MTPESEPAAPPPLTPGFTVLITAAAMLVQLVVFRLLVDLGAAPSPALFGIATILGFGGAFALGAPRVPPPPGASLGFGAAPRIGWAAALALLPSVLLVSEIDNIVRALLPLPEALRAPPERPEGLGVLQLALVQIVVVPAVEEVFFRGLVQPVLVSRLGRARGVLSQATLSGMSVLLVSGPWGFATRIAQASVLGWLRETTGSILPGLMLNALFGLTAVLAVWSALGIPGLDDTSVPHTPLAWLIPAAALTGIGLRLCRAAQTRLDRDARQGE